MIKTEDAIQLYYVEGDTLPTLTGVLYKNDNVTPEDITGWTITLHIRYRNHPLVKNAVIPSGPDGRFEFHWDTEDLINGIYDAEIQFISQLGIQTANINAQEQKFQFKIAKQIA